MQQFEISEDYKRINDLLYGGYIGIKSSSPSSFREFANP